MVRVSHPERRNIRVPKDFEELAPMLRPYLTRHPDLAGDEYTREIIADPSATPQAAPQRDENWL